MVTGRANIIIAKMLEVTYWCSVVIFLFDLKVNVSKIMTDRANITPLQSNMMLHMGFRLAYFELTLVPLKVKVICMHIFTMNISK